MTKNGSLNGVTVLDLSRLLPGPYCSMILADHGARVIHIESVEKMGGDLVSTPLPTLYRNKEHLALDLKSEEGKQIFYKLAQKADVILEGFRKGTTEKLGIDYETVKQYNSRIVYCSLTGYGQTGEKSELIGHDVNFMSMSGALNLFSANNKPDIPAVQIADHLGGLNAAIGILMALFAREKNGTGQYIDVSIADSTLSMMTVPFTLMNWGLPYNAGNSVLSGFLACYDTYETSDGRAISLGALEPKFFNTLCRKIGAEELIPFHYVFEKQNEIRKKLQEIFSEKTSDHWHEIFKDDDSCASVILEMNEAVNENSFKEREMIRSVKKDDKEISLIGIPVRLSETPGSVKTPPPDHGEHTLKILNDIGVSEKEINELLEKNIISCG